MQYVVKQLPVSFMNKSFIVFDEKNKTENEHTKPG